MSEEEIWRIVEEVPFYKVSNLGNIQRFIRGSKMNKMQLNVNIKQQLHNGYLIVKMRNGNKQVTRSVHRLVAKAFVKNDDLINKTEVNHIDLNKLNNSSTNLEMANAKRKYESCY